MPIVVNCYFFIVEYYLIDKLCSYVFHSRTNIGSYNAICLNFIIMFFKKFIM